MTQKINQTTLILGTPLLGVFSVVASFYNRDLNSTVSGVQTNEQSVMAILFFLIILGVVFIGPLLLVRITKTPVMSGRAALWMAGISALAVVGAVIWALHPVLLFDDTLLAFPLLLALPGYAIAVQQLLLGRQAEDKKGIGRNIISLLITAAIILLIISTLNFFE